VTYVKTEHSVKITEWIIENVPEELEQIAEIIKDKLQRQSPDVYEQVL
jgi:hypothetical protein